MVEISGETILEPSLTRTLSVWWAWSWRYVLFSLAAGFVLQLPKMGIAMILGGTSRSFELTLQVLTYASLAAGQVFTLWNLFDKRFAGFELRLEETSVREAQPAAPGYFAPTLNNAAEVWWSWFWRSFLGSFGLSFCLGLLLGVLGFSYLLTPVNASVLTALSWFAVSAFVLQGTLGMAFSHFKVRLIATPSINTEAFQIR